MPPTKAELMNLAHVLEVTLARLVKAGLQIDFTQPIEGKAVVSMVFYPMTLCNECGHLSAAAECLVCPAEAGGHG